jgi:steroid 5-alpha reductase family enzyme
MESHPPQGASGHDLGEQHRVHARRTGPAGRSYVVVGNSGTSNGTTGLWNWRQIVLSTAITVWAARLGSFLFARIMSVGKDSRFDKIRDSVPAFAMAFFAQATWVSLCLLPVGSELDSCR